MEGILSSPLEKRQACGELEIGKSRVIVLWLRGETALIQHRAGVDSGIDEMHRNSEVLHVALRLGPVAPVNAAILRRDAGMIIDERGLYGLQHAAADYPGSD